MDAEVLKRAIKIYGFEKQQLKAIEELSELIKAIIKNRLNPTVDTRNSVIEEMADTYIMLGQLALMIDPDSTREIERAINYKILRLDTRLNESSEEGEKK